MFKHGIDTIHKARDLWLEGFSFRRIAAHLKIKEHNTIFHWAKEHKWKELRSTYPKEKPSYPIDSLRHQLIRCTTFIDKIELELQKIDILDPSKKEKELLANYNRLVNLQLKIMKQLSVTAPIKEVPTKKNLFS